MKKYDPKHIEPKWQKIWEDTKLYQVTEDVDRDKAYVIDMFPYPSGAGLHVGHVRNFSISDTYALYLRQQGRNVLRTIGFDAFGLPTEQYAIKTGISPQEATAQNVDIFRAQLKRLGMSYDWSRELLTSDPNYYKWTQWIFLQLLKEGLAYQKENLQWWCEHDQTVLADEQVINGRCWRCENLVTKKSLKQWFFKITAYADQLLEGLDELDWPEKIKIMQRNWIGRSTGAQFDFKLRNIPGQQDDKHMVSVFTTRPDTLGGATFLVVSPELAKNWVQVGWKVPAKVQDYIEKSLQKSDIDRVDEAKAKTGVDTGVAAYNPLTKQEVPVWVADYVMGGYGTGAIMAVPAHDERDFEFAAKFKLPVVQVIRSEEEFYIGEGELINSGKFDGFDSVQAREVMTDQFGKQQVNYKMRDWLISRQRYWGVPIPVVHCPKCGVVPVPEKDLPVELPALKSYEPSGDGRSALARATDWVHVSCPTCGGKAERETDTMDGYACSSWYFLRYTDPHNQEKAWDKAKADYWMPVDTYVGGDHAVAHLLYARFWTRFFHEQKSVKVKEPFSGLRYNGYILAQDGSKMSKSKGSVVNPNELIDAGYGADALRMYELFIGPYDQNANWNPNGIDGTKRFLNRVWVLVQDHLAASDPRGPEVTPGVDAALETALASATHKTIKKVTADLEDFGFNTAIAAMMELVNEMYKLKLDLPLSNPAWRENLKLLIQMLAPFAPHITEELWQQVGEGESVHISGWPAFDAQLVKDELVTIVTQVNGKVRAQIQAATDSSEAEVVKAAKADETIKRHLEGRRIVKTIFVSNKLINFVVT